LLIVVEGDVLWGDVDPGGFAEVEDEGLVGGSFWDGEVLGALSVDGGVVVFGGAGGLFVVADGGHFFVR
jgi:hypothetical protein